jgi:hypothetical protein
MFIQKATNFVFPNTNESGNRIYLASEISEESAPEVISAFCGGACAMLSGNTAE